ncbi:hypothetical protein ACO0LG_01485 [Undibacterium sp. Ji42W]|uniref:hypothetical protein n=1 Tax=Undibacterium sp. Ji42W TaxID=3413039 RepID=UPI003BF346B2
MTILSTNSDYDLSLANNELIQFVKKLPGIPEEKYLLFENKWFLASNAGCSCNFRHLSGGSIELRFGEPEAWFQEDDDTIEATRQIAASIRTLIQQGANVDCFDAWVHGQSDAISPITDIEVDLSEVSDTTFRFFEEYRFSFTIKP